MKNDESKKEGPGFPRPWVAIGPSVRISVTEAMNIVKKVLKTGRTLTPHLSGERQISMRPAGAGLEPASLHLTDGRSTIKLPGKVLPIIRVESQKSSLKEPLHDR